MTMTTDITDLAQSLKAAAEKASGGDWVKESGDGWDATCSNDDQANSGFIIAHFVGPDSEANREFVQLANPANIRALVEALDKAQSAKRTLESLGYIDNGGELWRPPIGPKPNFSLMDSYRQRIAELEEAEQKICAANVTLDARAELAERRLAEMESRTVTVKLPPKIERDDADDWFMYKGGRVGGGAAEWYNKALDDVGAELTAAGIKWEAE